MKPTALLEKEHVLILNMLRVLEAFCQRLEAGEQVGGEHIDQILEFIETFVNRCHHEKEELLLFPALEAVGLPREGGPIGLMLQEHDLGRRYISALRGALKRYRGGEEAGAIASIVENASLYIALLTQHIDVEDHILFKIADIHLGPEKQDELSTAFRRVDEEVLGNGKREASLELLNQFSWVYLSEAPTAFQSG